MFAVCALFPGGRADAGRVGGRSGRPPSSFLRLLIATPTVVMSADASSDIGWLCVDSMASSGAKGLTDGSCSVLAAFAGSKVGCGSVCSGSTASAAVMKLASDRAGLGGNS